MYYLLIIILFLKPSIRKEDLPAQFGRAYLGGIFSFLLLYMFKFDRSPSFILSMLWLPVIFQLIFSAAGLAFNKAARKKVSAKGSPYFGLITTLILLLSIGYNSYPYITGGFRYYFYG